MTVDKIKHYVFRPLIRLFIIVLGVYTILCLVAFLNQEKVLFRSWSAELPMNWKPSIGYPYEELLINNGQVTENGEEGQLYGIKFLSPKNLGTVLYFHGNAYSMEVWQKAAVPYLERGFNVVIPTYRGFSKSKGKYNSQTEVLEDAQKWYKLVSQKEKNLIVVGRSMGTGIATYIAANWPVDRLLLETPYDSLAGVANQRFPFNLLPVNLLIKYPMLSKEWINQVKAPIYVIHGTIDGVIRPERVTELLMNAPVALIKWVPGANHLNYTTSMIYTEWLNDALLNQEVESDKLELAYKPPRKKNSKQNIDELKKLLNNFKN